MSTLISIAYDRQSREYVVILQESSGMSAMSKRRWKTLDAAQRWANKHCEFDKCEDVPLRKS